MMETLQNSIASIRAAPPQLFAVFLLKFCESYNYFAVSQVLVLYLHSDPFNMSDLQAGAIYGLWGTAILFFGLLFSTMNDKLGVQKALMIGFSLSALATIIMALTSSKFMMQLILFTIYPLGNSLGLPMLTVGVKKYTTDSNRGFAFGLYYSVMNIGAFFAGIAVDILNHLFLSNGNRAVILSTAFVSLFSFSVAYILLVDSQHQHVLLNAEEDNDDDNDEEEQQHNINETNVVNPILSSEDVAYAPVARQSSNDSLLQEEHSERTTTNLRTRPTTTRRNSRQSNNNNNTTMESPSHWKIVVELFSSATFWRFVVFSFFLVILKSVFRHLDATLPTYLVREFGNNVPKGTIYSINPFMIMFMTPVVGALTNPYAHYDMIKYGSVLTALAPFFLAVSNSIGAAVCMVVVLSLGEAIWSPRTYGYTMSIAPEGREASFAALATAPLFLATVPVGLMSGWLVSTYLPEDGTRQPRMLWFIVGMTTLISPIAIICLERWIREPVPSPVVVVAGDEDEEMDNKNDDDSNNNNNNNNSRALAPTSSSMYEDLEMEMEFEMTDFKPISTNSTTTTRESSVVSTPNIPRKS